MVCHKVVAFCKARSNHLYIIHHRQQPYWKLQNAGNDHANTLQYYCGSICSVRAGWLLDAASVALAPAQKYIPNGGGKKVEATLKGEGGRRGVGSHVGGITGWDNVPWQHALHACPPTRLPCKHGCVTAGQTC